MYKSNKANIGKTSEYELLPLNGYDGLITYSRDQFDLIRIHYVVYKSDHSKFLKGANHKLFTMPLGFRPQTKMSNTSIVSLVTDPTVRNSNVGALYVYPDTMASGQWLPGDARLELPVDNIYSVVGDLSFYL